MEVKDGYKQMELGIIPDDWDERTLLSISSKITDGDHLTPKREAEGNYLLSARNIRDSYIDLTDVDYVGDEEYTRMRQRCAPEVGDILMSCSGHGLGRASTVPQGLRCVLVRSAALIKLNPRKADGLFIQYCLQAPYVQRQIFSGKSLAAQPNLFINSIERLRCLLPASVSEQRAIATALSDADALIESLQELIGKKCRLKQGAMQELLGRRDGWATKRLGNTAVLKARIGWQGLTTAEYLDAGDFYLVTGTDFANGYIDWTHCAYVAESRYRQDKNIQLRENDVLVTKDGTIGKVAFVDHLDKPATLNSGVFVIRPIEGAFNAEFFYYLLCSKVFAEFLGQLSAGSTINHLYQKDFVNFIYKMPTTLAEQSAIARILRDMDTEIAALKAKLSKARHLKQGMMQELLTGRTRLV
jgi:type I restriction enzyme S subunit